MVKGEFHNQGLVNLNYTQIETRARLHIGELDFSVGVAARQHMAYGYNPISTYLQTNPWWDLAHEYGYEDISYGIDYDNDDVVDNFDWYWIKDGERVADTDAISADTFMAASLMITTKPVLMRLVRLVHYPQLLVSTIIITRKIFGFIRGEV